MTKTSIHSPFWAHCTSCLCSLAKAEKNLIVGILGFVKLVFAFPLMGKHTLSDWQLAHTPFTRDGIWVKECWCVKCRSTIHDFTNFLSTYFGEGIQSPRTWKMGALVYYLWMLSLNLRHYHKLNSFQKILP